MTSCCYETLAIVTFEVFGTLIRSCFSALVFPVTLQMLYKLKTSKVFEKPKAAEGRAADLMEEDPFAVQMVSWCPQSRIFCVVGISAHIILYRFSKHDANAQIVVGDTSQSGRSGRQPGFFLYKLILTFWFVIPSP